MECVTYLESGSSSLFCPLPLPENALIAIAGTATPKPHQGLTILKSTRVQEMKNVRTETNYFLNTC